ncbi:uncharacterized protein LOC108298585 [Cebus imitator]|uniref:uncharacterized protein LOC108298585 n=1 Tax=Cebus imitator TaxID=2715852 RepID=UPI001898AD7F|nr:uncharacterized protein LOC108298585 [Cebus imitator]
MPESLVSLPSEAYRDFKQLNREASPWRPRQGHNQAVQPKQIQATHWSRPVPRPGTGTPADWARRAASVPERERVPEGWPPWQVQGWGRGAPGGASRGSRPVTWAPAPAAAVGPLVGRLAGRALGPAVGRWACRGASGLLLAAGLSCLKVGGTRERPAHLSRLERSRGPASSKKKRRLGSQESWRLMLVMCWKPPWSKWMGSLQALKQVQILMMVLVSLDWLPQPPT